MAAVRPHRDHARSARRTRLAEEELQIAHLAAAVERIAEIVAFHPKRGLAPMPGERRRLGHRRGTGDEVERTNEAVQIRHQAREMARRHPCPRSEERRVGKECVNKFSSRWWV